MKLANDFAITLFSDFPNKPLLCFVTKKNTKIIQYIKKFEYYCILSELELILSSCCANERCVLARPSEQKKKEVWETGAAKPFSTKKKDVEFCVEIKTENTILRLENPTEVLYQTNTPYGSCLTYFCLAHILLPSWRHLYGQIIINLPESLLLPKTNV